MKTSQVKKGNPNRKRSKHAAPRDKDGKRQFRRPPLDRRIPGWQRARWDAELGAWVINR